MPDLADTSQSTGQDTAGVQAQNIEVEIGFVSGDGRQFLKKITLPAGGTAAHAIQASGLQEFFPDTDFALLKIGIFGALRPPDTILRQGQRVEVYRTLQVDPMEARRRRALKKN